MKIFLAVLSAYDPALPGVTTLYYASSPGYVSGAADTPAHQFFDPRLIQPVAIRRSLFAPGTTQGGTQIALGELVLNNADGGLDALLDYGLDGRDLVVYHGDRTGAFPDDFEEVFRGTMQQAFGSRTRVTIRVRDRQYDTRQPVQATLYAGTNALPAGVEGTPDDLQGKPKPLTLGVVFNAPGVRVNTDRNLYQWHTGALQSLALYDRGEALSLGTAHASLAALEGATVTAGTYHTWLAGGMARTSGAEGEVVTADAVEGATAADRTAGQVAERLLLLAGWDAGDIDAAAIAALDAHNPAEVGLFLREPSTVAAALDHLLRGVPAWWGQAEDGTWTAAPFTAPSGTPDAAFTRPQLLRLEPEAMPESEGGGIPFWRVVVRYARNHQVQRGDQLDASVTAARRAWLAEEYREAVAEDADVLTAHPLAPTLTITTALTEEADAQALADAELALRGVQRRRFGARVALDEAGPAAVPLGGVVEITHDRFGLSAGALFRVLSVEPDARRGRLNFTLWG